MKKFRFRLERVLEYRNIVKDEKLRELLLKNGLVIAAEEKLKELEQAQAGSNIEEGTVLGAHEVELRGRYGQRIRQEISEQIIKIEEARAAAREALDQYIEAAKDARSLELFKAKKKSEYIDYINKEDEKFLDEISTQKGNSMSGELETSSE